MIKVESDFDPDAVSRDGAQGLMQLMPGTAKDMGVTDSFDSRQNIEGGTKYIKQQIDKYDSVEKALAAYNAGPRRVDEYGGVPPFTETQKYIKDVLEYYKKYNEEK
jgi:soluble lytic murein transglycosylase-like protein